MVNFAFSYLIKPLVGIALLIILQLGAIKTYAQDFESEKDLQKNAAKLFDKGEYVEAFPLYSQLLSIYPDNITYNYKFSVCMYPIENRFLLFRNKYVHFLLLQLWDIGILSLIHRLIFQRRMTGRGLVFP